MTNNLEQAGKDAGRELVGPCGLEEALALSTPDESGLRLALSVPNGDLVAVSLHGATYVRRCMRQTGRGGSVVGTGRPVTLEDARRQQWRPA